MTVNPTSDDLVAECQGLVRFLAKQVRTRTPAWVETDDLIGYGQVGLLQAARDFDSTKGVKFSTFAYYRIRGAIYDGVNKLMWFKAIRNPENNYPETKFGQMADSYIQTTIEESETTQRADTNSLSKEATWFSRSVGALAMSYLTTTEASTADADVVDKSETAPWSSLVEQETRTKISQVIDQLPADLAALIHAVYYEDCTLQEAANQLNVSKSWASRMHARALEQMAKLLREANY